MFMPLLKDDNTIEGETKREQEKRAQNEAILREWDKDNSISAKKPVPQPEPVSYPDPLVKLDQAYFSRYRVGEIDIKCPVCGHTYFKRSDRVLAARDALFFHLAWLNGGAIALHCQKCRAILWMDNTGNSGILLYIALAVIVGLLTLWGKSHGG
jgi:hypothetical protein